MLELGFLVFLYMRKNYVGCNDQLYWCSQFLNNLNATENIFSRQNADPPLILL